MPVLLGAIPSNNNVSIFEKIIENKYDIQLDLLDYKNGDLHLSKIIIPKEKRGKGIGKKVLQEIIDFANKLNRRITLTPSTDYGSTSLKRLKKFYKTFDFVENKGKFKDYTTREAMYKNPKNI